MHKTDKRNIKLVILAGAAQSIIWALYSAYFYLQRGDDGPYEFSLWSTCIYVLAQWVCLAVAMWFLHRFFRMRRTRRGGGKKALFLVLFPLIVGAAAAIRSFIGVYLEIRETQAQAEAEEVCSLAVQGKSVGPLEERIRTHGLTLFETKANDGYLKQLRVSNAELEPRWFCIVDLDFDEKVVESRVDIVSWSVWD